MHPTISDMFKGARHSIDRGRALDNFMSTNPMAYGNHTAEDARAMLTRNKRNRGALASIDKSMNQTGGPSWHPTIDDKMFKQ